MSIVEKLIEEVEKYTNITFQLPKSVTLSKDLMQDLQLDYFKFLNEVRLPNDSIDINSIILPSGIRLNVFVEENNIRNSIQLSN